MIIGGGGQLVRMCVVLDGRVFISDSRTVNYSYTDNRIK